MKRLRIGLLVVSLGLLLTHTTSRAVTAEAVAAEDDVFKLAGRIDHHIDKRLTAGKVTPAPMAADAEFLRRVYLDIAGKIPTVWEVREFLADASPDKRRQVVDRLLESPSYITNFTTIWRRVMMPEGDNDFQVRALVPGFEAWLRKKLTDDDSYSDMVSEILTVPLTRKRGFNPYQPQGEPTPFAFYQSKQVKPENLAAATSRMFLGIRIECAQCHDHPFDSWKREEFWSFAAFYAGIERQGDQGLFGMIRELMDRRELAIPDTDKVVQASFLDGKEPRWKFRQGPRVTLAQWVTSKENPYFARTGANRMWGHFFGIGLVDPIDDFTSENPPSHPELLDELAKAYSDHDFNIKFLIRSITASRAYQRTSRKTDASQKDPRLFARMSLKGMTPEQIFNSLSQATGFFQPFNARNVFVLNSGNTPQGELMEAFANVSENTTRRQTTILQGLAMMNGRFIANATALENSQTLAALIDYPSMNTTERIEVLYLASLSRKPRDEELSRFVKYVDQGGPTKDSKQALGDVFWALLNSSEFMFNH